MQPLLFSLLLSSYSLFLFLLSFPFAGVIFELIGPKKPALRPFFTQTAANFVKIVFKKLCDYQRIRQKGKTTHLTKPSEQAAITKYNVWQLSIKSWLDEWLIISAAFNVVRDMNLISDKFSKSFFLRLRRWLLKENEYSPKKTIGDVIVSLWQPSVSTSMSDRLRRQHLSDARPPPEKRRRLLVLSLLALGWSRDRGRFVTLKALTLDMWPWAVKNGEVKPEERLAEVWTIVKGSNNGKNRRKTDS